MAGSAALLVAFTAIDLRMLHPRLSQKRMSRSTWQGRRRGRLPFSRWTDEWWAVWSTDPSRSPTTLAATEIRLRRHVRPFFGDRPIEAIQPMLIRQWRNQLPSKLGHESLMACRSILFRILQLADDEGAISGNPLRRVPPPKRRIDPEKVLGQAKRRAYTPEEAGRLLASCPLFWWDHVLVLLGTGLRFDEFAGLRCSRVQLERPLPVLQVVDVRYQAGRFGSGFKPRPKSDAGIREIPLAPLVVEAIRGQLPPPAPSPTHWCSPVPAAATTWSPEPGPCCPGTASVACTRLRSSALTSTTSSSAAPHDFRHTFSTWLEDAGIPARVIDELMGHQRSRHRELDGGRRIGARYRHTTDAMAIRVVEAIQERLTIALRVAQDTQADRQDAARSDWLDPGHTP